MNLLTLFVLVANVVNSVAEFYVSDTNIRDICMNVQPQKVLSVNFFLPLSSAVKISVKQISWLLVSDTANYNPVTLNDVQTAKVYACCGTQCDFGLNNAPWHQAPCGVKPVCSPKHRMIYADFKGTDIDINGTDPRSTFTLSFTEPLPIGITIFRRIAALSLTYQVLENTTSSFTATATPTVTETITLTPSETYSPTMSESCSQTAEATPSRTPDVTSSPTPDATSSQAQTQTSSQTPDSTLSQTPEATLSQTQTQTSSQTQTQTSSQTPEATFSQTPEATSSQTATRTPVESQITNSLRGTAQVELVNSNLLTLILIIVSTVTITSCTIVGIYCMCKNCNSTFCRKTPQITYTMGSFTTDVPIRVESISVQPQHINIIPMQAQSPRIETRNAITL